MVSGVGFEPTAPWIRSPVLCPLSYASFLEVLLTLHSNIHLLFKWVPFIFCAKHFRTLLHKEFPLRFSIMHPEARHFTLFVKHVLPSFFDNVVALDAGGGDINGHNGLLFTNTQFECNDVYPAPNVTIVSRTGDLPHPDGHFDTICSTESFEHDPEYEKSLQNITRILKPGGLFLFTCASTGRPEHGTRRTSPQESWGTRANIDDMQDYYKNLTIGDISASGILDEYAAWRSYYNPTSRDLYFFGIKRGPADPPALQSYVVPHIQPTGGI